MGTGNPIGPPRVHIMLFLIKIAWMNSFRNARRTSLAGLAIGIGLAALIFTDGLMIGMSDTIVRIATDTFMGHGQVHAEGFRSTRDVARVVRGLPRVLERLRNDPQVERMTLRVQTPGMLASPATSGTVLLYGVDPGLERPFSKVDEAIVEGSFLEREDRRKILVGSKLAEALEIGLGDRVVVTAAEAESGELAQDMFRVGGIFRFGVRELDGGVGFAHIETVRRLLGLPGEVHEIALHLKSFSGTEAMDAGFWSRFSRNGNEARSWRELMPQLSAILDMSGFSSLIVGVILFAVVSLGIVNTLFMSLHERIFEYGVLRAVGTSPARMAMMILFEAGALSLLSIPIGCGIGFAVTFLYSVLGIDYSGIDFAGVTLRELIFPVLRLEQFVLFPVCVFLFTLVAGIYPAVFAARLKPAQAMKMYE